MSQEQLSEKEVRIQKVQKLQKMGIIPYANRFEKTHTIKQLNTLGKEGKVSETEILMGQGAQNNYSTAGRFMSWRTHGKLSFAKIRDNSGNIQLCFVKGKVSLYTGKELVTQLDEDGNELNIYKFIDKYIDVGDFVGVKGELFMTKHGELTLFVNEVQLLSKAIRPLPEKFHGIQDQEEIYRKRYLDMTMNEESYQRFLFRSNFLKALRDFYHENGFIEIETPVLGNAASGAAAKPFITHHNDFDADFYLRISPETALKKATVGRMERVFEVSRNFRNEGSDPSHVQEFTAVEHYAVYWNFEDNIKFTEQMFDYLFEKLGLSKTIKVKDKEGKIKQVDFTTPWEKIDYVQGVKKESGIDIDQYDIDDADKLRADIKAKGIEFEGMDTMGLTTLIDYLYKKVLRPKIVGPAFVYNYPKTMQPLARASDDNPDIVEQFQVVVNGWEILKAYSELVDPLLQKANFEQQAVAVAQGDEEATAGDDDFVLAMEHGMPPQSGRGMGIERVVAILTEQDNLRDVQLFPLMKSANGEKIKGAINNSDEDIDYGKIPEIGKTKALVEKYLEDTKNHCEEVGQVMQYFAKKLNKDESLRYTAGILHDIDRDYIQKDADKHLQDQFIDIMKELDAPDQLIKDIRAHYPDGTEEEPQTLLAKYLISIDELTAFIKTVSLMRPDGFEGMKVSSIKKKIKDKKFAAGVDRAHLTNCEKYLSITLDEFIPEIIEALK